MKKVVKYFLSVSSTVMTLPSNNITNTMELPSDIREENVTSITFDVGDDSIPIAEGVPTNTFRWLEELP